MNQYKWSDSQQRDQYVYQNKEINDLENKITIRQTFQHLLSTHFGLALDILIGVLSILGYVLYVLYTYEAFESQIWQQMMVISDVTVVIIYSLDFLMRLLADQHKLHFLIQFYSIIDIVTIILSSLFYFKHKTFRILVDIGRTLRFWKFLKIISKRYEKAVSDSVTSSVDRQFVVIFLTVVTFVFISSGILLALQKPEQIIPEDQFCRNLNMYYNAQTIQFHRMLYFVVVTFATVGYGDIIPTWIASRLFVIFLIVLVIVIIPKQTNQLIRLLDQQSIYARMSYQPNPEIPFVVLSGYVSVSALKDFCSELLHLDHGTDIKNVVILQQNVPNPQMDLFLNHPHYQKYLTYLQGEPRNKIDMGRAAVTSANAIILLTNKYSQQSNEQDYRNILTSLAIKKFIKYSTGKEARIIMQLIKPESKFHYYSSVNKKNKDQILVVQQFKMNLLAKSCFCPGIISLVSNLVTSASEGQQHELMWMKQYTVGKGHEIYRICMSPKFINKKFNQIASIIYTKFQTIAFAIEIQIMGEPVIRLNPGSFLIKNNINQPYLYVICQNKQKAQEIQKYEMSAQQIIMFNNQKSQKLIVLQQVSEIYEQNDDQEQLFEDYNVVQQPMSLVNVYFRQLDSQIKNHILVCGIHPSMYYFILSLRAKYLLTYQTVVILSTNKPSDQFWDQIKFFQKIYFVQGSALTTQDLLRVNVNTADKAVILASQQQSSQQMLDSQSIFIYKAIKKINDNVKIMIQIVNSGNIQFLNSKHDIDTKYDLSDLFAAGQVYISTIIDTLLCQNYYNFHSKTILLVITILQQILTGQKIRNRFIRNIIQRDYPNFNQSNLWQIPVPQDFVAKTFGSLFAYLSQQRNLVPLGLYRLPGVTDNDHPYTFTNPSSNIKLQADDRIFVLACTTSKDLFNLKEWNQQGNERFIELPQIGQKKQLFYDIQKLQTNIMQIKSKVTSIPQKNKSVELSKINLLESTTLKIIRDVQEQLIRVEEQIGLIKDSIEVQNRRIVQEGGQYLLRQIEQLRV